jgi:hypothetical protein
MSRLGRFAVAVALGLALAGRSAAVAPEIKDDAKLFSAEALKKANEQLRDIFRTYRRDFLMETFAAPQSEPAEKVKALADKERSAFFIKWAISRSDERVVNGVYVLFCKDPEYLVVGISNPARRVLSGQDRKKIDEIIRRSIGEKKPDEGLQAAIKYVRDKLSSSR